MKAICYANRQKSNDKTLINRILVIQMEKDDTSKYSSIVNGFFACEKMNITIDCLVLKQDKA